LPVSIDIGEVGSYAPVSLSVEAVMARHLDKVWLLLVVVAVAVTVACSSTSTTPDDAGEGAPDALTKG
jgi:hypothetical protein